MFLRSAPFLTACVPGWNTLRDLALLVRLSN
jgi:hypothetical protein